MAGVNARAQLRALLRLRRRLTFRQFKNRPNELFALIVFGLFLVPVPIILAVVTGAAYQGAPEPWPAQILALVLSALWLFWAGYPVFVSPFNDSLDISRLLVYPISARTMVTSMIAGFAYDFMAWFTVPLLFAVVVTWSSGVGAVIVIIATLLAFVHMIVACQLVSTVLAGILSSRRFRDVMIVVGAATVFGLWSIQFWIDGLQGSVDKDQLRSAFAAWRPLDGLSWLPVGSGARAISEVSAGDWVSALLWLAYCAGTLGLLIVLWWRLLRRAMFNGGALFVLPEKTAAVRKRSGVGRFLPARIRHLVEKELWLTWRSPRRRINVIQAFLMSAILIVVWFRETTYEVALSFAPVAWMAFAALTSYQNVLGIEGDGLTSVMVSPLPRARLFLSKLVAFAMMSVIPVLLACGIMLWRGMGMTALLALTTGAAVMSAWFVVGSLLSVKFPFRVPEEGKRAAWRNRMPLSTSLATMILGPIGTGLLSLPALGPHLLTVMRPSGWLIVIVALWNGIYAVVLGWAGAKWAGRVMLESEPNIYTELNQGNSS